MAHHPARQGDQVEAQGLHPPGHPGRPQHQALHEGIEVVRQDGDLPPRGIGPRSAPRAAPPPARSRLSTACTSSLLPQRSRCHQITRSAGPVRLVTSANSLQRPLASNCSVGNRKASGVAQVQCAQRLAESPGSGNPPAPCCSRPSSEHTALPPIPGPSAAPRHRPCATEAATPPSGSDRTAARSASVTLAPMAKSITPEARVLAFAAIKQQILPVARSVGAQARLVHACGKRRQAVPQHPQMLVPRRHIAVAETPNAPSLPAPAHQQFSGW